MRPSPSAVKPLFILSNLDSWLESSCHDFWPQRQMIFDHYLELQRIEIEKNQLDHEKIDFIISFGISLSLIPDLPLNRRQPSQLVPSIQFLIFIELSPPPSFDIYFVPGSGRCISICCQNLWFSDKNCILKQFEEKLLKLHFSVCQMMFL